MTGESRRHLTLAGIVAGLTLVGSMLGGATKWAIDLNDRLDRSEARRDSVALENLQLIERVARLEKYHGVKGARKPAAERPRRGLIRKVFGLLF